MAHLNIAEVSMNIWLTLLLFLFLALGVYGCVKWFDIFNSPDGERYRRMRTQGPFAPLRPEDIGEDEQRQKKGPSPS